MWRDDGDIYLSVQRYQIYLYFLSFYCKFTTLAVTDLGFTMGGGRRPRRGGADSRGNYVSKILYVKTKESRPIEGRAPGTPPRSAID